MSNCNGVSSKYRPKTEELWYDTQSVFKASRGLCEIVPGSSTDPATEQIQVDQIYETFESTLRAQALDIQQLNSLCVNAASSQRMVRPAHIFWSGALTGQRHASNSVALS